MSSLLLPPTLSLALPPVLFSGSTHRPAVLHVLPLMLLSDAEDGNKMKSAKLSKIP